MEQEALCEGFAFCSVFNQRSVADVFLLLSPVNDVYFVESTSDVFEAEEIEKRPVEKDSNQTAATEATNSSTSCNTNRCGDRAADNINVSGGLDSRRIERYTSTYPI